MHNSKADISSDLELQRLAVQIEELIRVCDTLKKENQFLKTRQHTLIREKADLVHKTGVAKSRIEAMVTRLKLLEDVSQE